MRLEHMEHLEHLEHMTRIERQGARALVRQLDRADERARAEAYEFGRAALTADLGILDMALLLRRIVAAVPARDADASAAIESFLLESLSPFEMGYRGAREANEALRRIEERREEHARRIALELHDNAGQLVARVRFALDALRPLVAPEGAQALAAACELLENVGEELRRLAHELRPAILDQLGLIPALRFLADSAIRRSGIAVSVIGAEGARLPRPIETAVFRTTQEALANAVRHSRASRVEIEVNQDAREMRWEIRDDGRGFDPDFARDRTAGFGLGLAGIRERLAPLGGEVEIHSHPGAGTAIVARIPLEVSHAHQPAVGG